MTCVSRYAAVPPQARRVENELDVKLASFRRSQNAPAVDGQTDGNEAEIETLLLRLNDVNLHMQNWLSDAGSDVLSHTLARHQNVLHELNQEFARIRITKKADREHDELLQYFGKTELFWMICESLGVFQILSTTAI